jgi:hypothetical protein
MGSILSLNGPSDKPGTIHKDAAETGGRPSEATIDELQRDVEEASDAIDDVVDTEQPR